MRTITEIQSAAGEIVSLFNNFAEQYKLEGLAVADHIGFKCGSTEEFETMRAIFEANSDYFYQSFISERRISMIKLSEPFATSLGNITHLELSDQKPDGSQESGFDHLEIYPIGMAFEELVGHLQLRGQEGKESIKPHHSTHNYSLEGKYTLKIEAEPIMEKIKRLEI